MTDKPINYGRRKVLTTTTALVGGIGIASVATPFVKSMAPGGPFAKLGNCSLRQRE